MHDLGRGAPGREPRILVVDDDRSIRMFMTIALEMEGYRVDTAADGAEALEKARRRRPDAIVVDLAMPGIDGRGFIAAWCVEPSVRRAPIVVMSGGSELVDPSELGAQGYLSKPFELSALFGKLAALLRPTGALSACPPAGEPVRMPDPSLDRPTIGIRTRY